MRYIGGGRTDHLGFPGFKWTPGMPMLGALGLRTGLLKVRGFKCCSPRMPTKGEKKPNPRLSFLCIGCCWLGPVNFWGSLVGGW